MTLRETVHDARAFNFSRTNGAGASGDLASAGPGKVIVLTPMPPGLAAGNKVYISGGTGTAESAAITAVSGGGSASTGSVTVTTVNAHSGAWTVGSVAGGIQEAHQAILAAGGTGKISVTTAITAYAPITIASGFTHIQGQLTSFSDALISRADSFLVGPIVRATGAGTMLMLSDLHVSAGSSAAPYAGVAVDTSASFIGRNLSIANAIYGFIADGAASVDIDGFNYGNYSSNVAVAGVLIGPTAQSNFRLSNATIVVPIGSLNKLLHCIYIQAVDGGHLRHLILSGTNGITFGATDSQFIANFDIDDFEIDAFTSYGIGFAGVPTTPSIAINVSNGNMNAQHAAGGTASGLDLGYSFASKADGVTFSNIKIYDCHRDGVRIGTLGTPKAIDFSGLQIFNCNVDASSYAGMRLAAGASGIRVRNSTIGNRGFGFAGLNYAGILTEGAVTDSMIAGNDLSNNGAAGAISLGGTFGGVIANNKGVGDVIAAAASAAALAFPPMDNGQTIKITGTTGVTSVSGLRTGQWGILLTVSGAVTFTAGATIATTLTTVTAVPVTWTFDGTRIFLK